MNTLIRCPEQFDYLEDSNVLKSFLSLDYCKSLKDVDIAIKGVSDDGTDTAFMRNITFWIDAVSDPELDIQIINVLKIIDNGDISPSITDLQTYKKELDTFHSFPIFVASRKSILNNILEVFSKRAVMYFGADTLNSFVKNDLYIEGKSFELGTRISSCKTISKIITRLDNRFIYYHDDQAVLKRIKNIIPDQKYILVFDFDFLDASVSFGARQPAFGGISFCRTNSLLEAVIPVLDLECIVFISSSEQNDPDEISLNYAQEMLKKITATLSKKIILESIDKNK